MIPAPLAVPVDLRPTPGDPGRRWRRGALAAVLVAIAGAAVWAGAFSAFGYERFDVFDRRAQLSFRQGGEYLVFEEFDGASTPTLPSPLAIEVTDEDGRSVDVEALVVPGERAAPRAYDTPWHEGRAIARFEVDEGGSYQLEVEFLPGEPGRYRPFEQVDIAVGRQPLVSWFAGPGGLAVVVVVPLLAAAGCLVAARRADRRRAVDPDPTA